jgi:RimJ/RimL family protein N-acetyltransferase
VREVVAETERLYLHTCTEADVPELVPLGSPDVVRFLGGETWTETTVLASIRLWRDIDERLGITTWAVRTQSTDALIGTCGFAGTNAPWLRFDQVIEIGWTLGREWWGRGLASEAGSAALRVGGAKYPAERFISKCAVGNVASERVMQRLGMRRVGCVLGGPGSLTVVYRWRAH